MAKSKPRKKYNPQQKHLRRTRHRAAQCIAYQWEAEENEAGTTFNCAGPYSDEQCVELIQWAFHRKEHWIFTGIACFVDNDGQYYEEMVTLTTDTAWNLGENIAILKEYKQLAVNGARKEGNPLHYVTATFALSLQSTDLNRRMENDPWLKQQAERRADYVLANRDALRALNGQ